MNERAHCGGCIYWKSLSGGYDPNKGDYACHYMLETGKCRLKQVVDGVCTVRVERKVRNRRKRTFDVPGEQQGL